MLARPLLPAVLGLALAGSPVSASAGPDAPSPLGEAMRDPATQQTMAVAVRALSETLLNIRLAPLLKAIEAAQGGEPEAVDPDLTLRDYAGPEAARVPEEMSRRLPAMMGAMGEMTGAFEAALPGLRATAEQMRARIDQAMER